MIATATTLYYISRVRISSEQNYSYRKPVANIASTPTILAGRNCNLSTNGIGATTIATSLMILRAPVATDMFCRDAQRPGVKNSKPALTGLH